VGGRPPISPRSGEFPHTHAPLVAALFDALDAATVVRLLACVLCERRIVLRGSVHAQLLAAAEAVGVTMQPVRSPEEALADPAFLADGCVAIVDKVGNILINLA
jgi:hypothetical protein